MVVTPCRVTVQLIVENTPTKDQGQAAVGIDLGIKACITLSNGVQYAKRIRDNNKIMRLQKKLAKAEKGSNGRRKKKKQVAQACQRIALSESNLLHRITTALVKNQSNKFYIEKLNITGMVKNHKLAKSRHEQTWGMFQEQLTYKAENAGGWVRPVNPKNTSQRCHECQGMPAIKLTLADRTYRCRHCGYVGRPGRERSKEYSFNRAGVRLAGRENPGAWEAWKRGRACEAVSPRRTVCNRLITRHYCI